MLQGTTSFWRLRVVFSAIHNSRPAGLDVLLFAIRCLSGIAFDDVRIAFPFFWAMQVSAFPRLRRDWLREFLLVGTGLGLNVPDPSSAQVEIIRSLPVFSAKSCREEEQL